MAKGRNAAIILAAGLSSRSPGFKPLLPLGASTILERVISIFPEEDIDVCVVTGHRSGEILQSLKTGNLEIVHNPDYQHGMFTSIQAGVRTLKAEHESFFVMPVDIPLVRRATVSLLINEAELSPGKIIYPVFEGRRGHPPLIPASLIPEILAWNKDGGLKALLSGHTDISIEVAVPDSNILFDVDTPEDYEELIRRYQRIHIPTTAETEAILEINKVSLDIRQHSETVAEVAVKITASLNKSGQKVDVDLIKAAALLHDVAKGKPEHDAEGRRVLRNMGFSHVGDIVAAHTDLNDDDKTDFSIETRIIYLADKFVDGTRLVSIEERYQASNAKYAVTEEIKANIERRKARALKVQNEFEKMAGVPIP